jgi:hypothetical protein
MAKSDINWRRYVALFLNPSLVLTKFSRCSEQNNIRVNNRRGGKLGKLFP